MLDKAKRLTKKRDFAKLGNDGRAVFGPYATLRIRKTGKPEPLVAFITSTKVMKKAVDRNRAKRRMREVIRMLWAEIPKNVHLLFILKPETKDVPHAKLVEEVRRLLSKIPEALLKPAKLSPRAQKNAQKRAANPRP